MDCVPLNNGLDNARRRWAIDFFEGAPHVCWGVVLGILLSLGAFHSDDCILNSLFACVESMAVLGSQNALPATLGTKMSLPEMGEVWGPPWMTRRAKLLRWDVVVDSVLEGSGQVGDPAAQI